MNNETTMNLNQKLDNLIIKAQPHLPVAFQMSPTRAKWTTGVAFVLAALIVSPILTQPPSAETEVAASAPATPISKWKNSNIKPFATSPFYEGGKVIWDVSDQQWRCEFEEGGTGPCSKAEGKSQEQLTQDGEKARQSTADFQASEAQRHEEARLYYQGQEIIKSQQAPWYTR